MTGNMNEMDAHYRKLENMMVRAPFVSKFDCLARVSEGASEFSFPVTQDMFHGAGAVHGALCFFALDNAAMMAANSLVFDVVVFTTSFTIRIFRPISEGRVRADGMVMNLGNDRIDTEAVAYDDTGTEIARGSGSFVRTKLPLSARIGYA